MEDHNSDQYDNLVDQACLMASQNIWDKIDEQTGGMVTSATYMALFANDQVYNFSMMLEEILKGSPVNKFLTKKIAKDIFREVNNYVHFINGKIKVNSTQLSLITQSLEDDILPLIENYKDVVARTVQKNGITDMKKETVAIAQTMNMLCQMSCILIKHHEGHLKKLGIVQNPLRCLALTHLEELTNDLSNSILNKEIKIRLNDQKTIVDAFSAIKEKLFNAETFERAFTLAEEYEDIENQFAKIK